MTELSPEIAAKIEGLVRAGASPANAAAACGLERDAFEAWMRDGGELCERIGIAEAEARITTEIELRKNHPAAWLKRHRKPVQAPERGLTLEGQPRKSKAGRKMLNIDLAKLERLASQGLSQKQIAKNLGISEDTFHTRKRQFVAFSDAFKKGRAKFIDTLTTAYVDLIKEGNVAAIIHGTKVHLGWRENQPLVPIDNREQNIQVKRNHVEDVRKCTLLGDAIRVLKGLGLSAADEIDEIELGGGELKSQPAPDPTGK
jgi:hypothetical protein